MAAFCIGIEPSDEVAVQLSQSIMQSAIRTFPISSFLPSRLLPIVPSGNRKKEGGSFLRRFRHFSRSPFQPGWSLLVSFLFTVFLFTFSLTSSSRDVAHHRLSPSISTMSSSSPSTGSWSIAAYVVLLRGANWEGRRVQESSNVVRASGILPIPTSWPQQMILPDVISSSSSSSSVSSTLDFLFS